MAETKKELSRQLIGIQYLRAIAALMVAYFHLKIQFPEYVPDLNRYLLGSGRLECGVDLFFVISGFIMVVTSGRASAGDFAVKRIMRIVPLYWVMTTLLLVIAVLRPQLFRTTVTGAVYFVKSLLFIPYSNPGHNGEMMPLLSPGWTLNFEMFFYAIFALVLLVPNRFRIIVTTLVFVSVVSFARLYSGTNYSAEIGFYGDFQLFEFLFGMIIGQAYATRLPVMPTWAGCVVALAGFCCLLWGFPFLALTPASGPQVLLENALPAVAVVFGVLSLENVLKKHPLRGMLFLGDASYSIYLSHIFLLGAARFVWVKAGLNHESLILVLGFAVTGLLFTVAGGAAVHLGLEKPMLRVLQRIYRPRIPPAPILAGSEPA
jgi:exopolysaccharide production protein ExoZ